MVLSESHPIHQVHGWLASKYRPRRMAELFSRFAITRETRVLDIGGSLQIWQYAPVIPRLTFVNIYERPVDLPDEYRWLHGDGRALPYRPGDFDFVFSNSVIEHVGSYEDQRAFAREVLRLDAPFWIQTPAFGFPIEPHYLGIGVQWLPRWLAIPYARLSSARGLLAKASREAVLEILDGTRLLTVREMHALFPSASFWHERVLGLTKSVVAYRTPLGRELQLSAGIWGSWKFVDVPENLKSMSRHRGKQSQHKRTSSQKSHSQPRRRRAAPRNNRRTCQK